MNLKYILAAACSFGAIAITATPAANAQDKYVGEVFMTAANFCPQDTLPTDGQVLAINQNAVLYSLLGNRYGGNGTSTFALPDLRGRFTLHPGTGPGLPPYQLGEAAGNVETTLTTSNLPAHTHQLNASDTGPQTSEASDALLTNLPSSSPVYSNTGSANVQMKSSAISSTGMNVPVDITNPYLALTHCIVTVGLYPPRP